jgi:REP element-mobilizing transposase RayT
MASFVRVGAHSSTLLFVHLVWATRERHPLLEPSVDVWLAALLERKVLALDGEFIAAGNAADHVHVIVSYPPRVTVATGLPDPAQLQSTQDLFFKTFGWEGFKERAPILRERGIGQPGDFELRLGHHIANLRK